ncbi:MAG: ABC transporter permease [Clostridiales bacterium]|nr:ABC transporter permease [Clostridiales bacterium]
MKSITASLALSQLKNNRKRTAVTIIGIVLSVAMLTAVCGFAVSGIETMRRLAGDNSVSAYAFTLISMAAVLGVIIMTASVVVISNAFRISASERTRQFGILKSVGATSKQITKTMLREALYLAGISIPAGIVVGLLIQWLGASIGDFLLAPMNKLIAEGLAIHLRFEFSWAVILIAASVSLVTVLLSAWLPARRAAKISAIEAIRMTRDVKLRGKKLRTSKLVSALFGFEGTLAAKSIKRSRRSYRAMVTALAISIILFLACASLDSQMTMTINKVYANIDANSYTQLYINRTGPQKDYADIDIAQAEEITQALRAYPDTEIFGLNMNAGYAISAQNPDLTDALRGTLEPEQTHIIAALVTPDRAHYEALCDMAGVELGSNILINSAHHIIGGKATDIQPLRFYGQTLVIKEGDTDIRLPLAAQLTGAQVPQEIMYALTEVDIVVAVPDSKPSMRAEIVYTLTEVDVVVVVPDCKPSMCAWFGRSADLPGFIAYAEDTLAALFPPNSDTQSMYVYSVTDIAAITDMTRGLTSLINVFLYGFVGMLSLIGLTSVIAAISANVRLRAREFAMLVSAGMTQGGIRRMLALESVMSALKALLYGIPLGAAGAYLVYIAMTRNVGFGFVFPWLALAEAVLGVFVITLITTQYASVKLRRGGSIVEVIHAGEGV